ncbi:MAG: NADH-quinone oxidoreductase subunit A [Candidatus Eisenbacteria bacterium]|nr:NADH-quinone oxidoreductase subunit A [Candidatus Eisenbacteria bacterium]
MQSSAMYGTMRRTCAAQACDAAPGAGHDAGDRCMTSYGGLVIVLGLALLLPLLFIAASSLFGPRRSTAEKLVPYESGILPRGSVGGQIPVKYYLVAVIFLVFDVEVVFLFPWSVLFRRLGVVGLLEMGLFIAVLVLGLIYVWRKGALEWET